MTFKYNPLTGELNIFGVKESNTTPNQPQEHSGNGFWYYLASSSSVNVTNSYAFLTLPTLTKSWNNTGVELTADNEFTIPTAGVWTWTIKVTVEASQSNNFPLLGAVSINGSTSTFWSPAQNTFTGFLVLNKGDKVKGGYEAQSGSQTGEAPLVGGILETCFSMMLLTPSVNTSTNPSNKDSNSNSGNSSNNSNTSGNTNSGSNTNKPNSNTSGNTNPSDNTNNSNSNQNNNSGNNNSNKPITNPLTNFTVSPTSPIGYTFEATNAGNPILYNIYSWATSQGQHPLGNGTVTVPEDGNWSFSWTLPNYPQKDGFSLNIQVDVNGRTLAQTSQSSVSAPLKKGDQVTFNIMGYFPSSAPASDQINITLNPNDTSLTAQQG